MEKGCRLLRLPPELLEHIITFANKPALLELRLTCRTLLAAADHDFGQEYLSSLLCFILNPARVLRVQNILSTEAVAKHVRSIRLDLNPHEGVSRDAWYTVTRKSDFNALHGSPVRWQWNVDQWLHYGGAHATPMSSLRSLFEAIGRYSQIKVTLDLINLDIESETEPLLTRFPTFIYDIFDLVTSTNCTLTGLQLDNVLLSPETAAQILVHPRLLETLASNLDTVILMHQVFLEEHLTDAYSSARLGVLRGIIRNAKNTKSLKLLLPDDIDHSLSFWSPYADLVESFIPILPRSKIENLQFEDFHFTISGLTNILQRCANTLKMLDLDGVCLIESDAPDPWNAILRQIQTMPVLEEFSFRALAKHRNISEDIFWIRFTPCGQFEGEDNTRVTGTYRAGGLLERFLDENIATGMIYAEKWYDD